MNNVIDSSSWTGISSDPYAVLDARERVGELRFDESRKVWWWGILGLPLLFAFGAWLVYSEYVGSPSTGRHSALLNLPYFKGIMGLLIMGFAAGAIPRWRRRLANRSKTAPLVINDSDLSFGTPSHRIRLSAIRTLQFSGTSGTLAEVATRLSAHATEPGYGDRGSSMTFAIVSLIVDGPTPPVQLDLAALKGHPPRIGLILCDRIQKQQASVGSHV